MTNQQNNEWSEEACFEKLLKDEAVFKRFLKRLMEVEGVEFDAIQGTSANPDLCFQEIVQVILDDCFCEEDKAILGLKPDTTGF